MADTGEASLLVKLGVLRRVTRRSRVLLSHLVNNANGPDGIAVDDFMRDLAFEVQHLAELDAWFEELLPHEGGFHTLRQHRTLIELPRFRAVRSSDILDQQRRLLIRAVGTLDMGDLINVDIDGKGMTRFVQVARPEVMGIEA